jgi:nucleoside-diphosphate-sugar epimerase
VIDESRPVAPHNGRARRRVEAERLLRRWARRRGAAGHPARAGHLCGERLPLKRLEQGTPALLAEDDVYTNHMHADDLASIGAAGLFGVGGRDGSITPSTTAR